MDPLLGGKNSTGLTGNHPNYSELENPPHFVPASKLTGLSYQKCLPRYPHFTMSCPRSLSASSSPGLKWPCRCFCHLTTGVAWARGDRRGRGLLLRGRGVDAFTHAGAATAHCACLVLQSPDHSFACSAPLQRLAPPLRIKTRYATPQAATVAVSATRPVFECTAHTTGNGPTPDGICRTPGAQPGAPHQHPTPL